MPESLKLYLDQMFQMEVAQVLREQGYDVIRAMVMEKQQKGLSKFYLITIKYYVKIYKIAFLNGGSYMSSVQTSYDHIALNEKEIPIIRGTTMKVVELVVEKLAHGWSPEELHFQHPYLTLGQVS